MLKHYLSCFTVCLTISTASAECKFNGWLEYQEVKLLRHPSQAAYIFATDHKAVDADGAPNAYHPDDLGLDYLANAGYPSKSWWKDVLVQDPANPHKAFVQADGVHKGYFVSKTSLQDPTKQQTDPSRYVNASQVPYLVYPGSYYQITGTGRLGDLGVAINLKTLDQSAFVVADIGPRNAELGEMSIALAEGLGGRGVNPRNGAGVPEGEVLYAIFPYSSRANSWPMTNEKLQEAANDLLDDMGGKEVILNCTTQAM